MLFRRARLGRRAQLSIETRLADREREERVDDGGVLVSPVEPRPGEEADAPAVDAGLHPVAIPIQFVDPLAAFGAVSVDAVSCGGTKFRCDDKRE